ncbi:MAG: FAD-dependent oxidoreductase [Bacilli bacterium]|nr:FAD-dependent oxidoreductase [Bacilli bacterium]
MYDVIMVGGGPAGITAGIYTARAGLKTLILERETIGGQIAVAINVENYPGFISITGPDLANNMYEQALHSGAEYEFENVINIHNGEIKKVVTEDNSYDAKTVIIATGTKYRKLGLDAETKYVGNGVHFCTSCDGAFYKDKIVAVVGGANTAVSNALYLSDIAAKVYLIYRGDKLKSEKKLEKELLKKANVEIMFNSTVEDLIGEKKLEEIKIKQKGMVSNLKIDGLFESIGMDAQTELVDDLLQKSEDNYIISQDCTTDREGIFVAGDCREKKEIRQLTTASSDGTVAATLVIEHLQNKKDK